MRKKSIFYCKLGLNDEERSYVKLHNKNVKSKLIGNYFNSNCQKHNKKFIIEEQIINSKVSSQKKLSINKDNTLPLVNNFKENIKKRYLKKNSSCLNNCINKVNLNLDNFKARYIEKLDKEAVSLFNYNKKTSRINNYNLQNNINNSNNSISINNYYINSEMVNDYSYSFTNEIKKNIDDELITDVNKKNKNYNAKNKFIQNFNHKDNTSYVCSEESCSKFCNSNNSKYQNIT